MKPHAPKPSALTHADGQRIVERLQEILYLPEGDDLWDPDNEWGSDTLQAIGELMAQYGLVVEWKREPQPPIWFCKRCTQFTLGPEHPCAQPCEAITREELCGETDDLASVKESK